MAIGSKFLRGSSHSWKNPSGKMGQTSDIMIPAYLRSNLLAYWDSRNTPSVSLPLTNLVTNGDFSSGTTEWIPGASALSAAGNIISNTGDGSGQTATSSQQTTYNPVTSKKFYMRVYARVTNPNCIEMALYGIGYAGGYETQFAKQLSNPAQNTFYPISGVITFTGAASGNLRIVFQQYYADAATANGKVMEVQYVSCIDLTAMFGAGNEPTALEMDAILAYNFPTTSWFDGTADCVINPVTVPMTNLVTNGDFSDGMTGWQSNAATLSESSGIAKVTGDGSATVSYFYSQNIGVNCISGHQYYVSSFYTYNIKNTYLALGVQSTATWQLYVSAPAPVVGANLKSVIVSPLVSETFRMIATSGYINATDQNGSENQFDNVIVIDLTATFGAGYEPSAAAMDAMLAAYAPGTSWFDGTQNVPTGATGRIFLPDTSGNGQHLKYRNVAYTAASGPQVGPPPYEKMDGVDDYMRRKLTTPIASGSAVSVSFWAKIATPLSLTRFIYLSNGTGGDDLTRWSMIVFAPADDMVIARTCSGVGFQQATGLTDLVLFHHIVSSYNPVSKKITIFINSVARSESDALTAPMQIVTDVILGASSGIGDYTEFSESDICIFNKTLTDSDVLALFQYSRNRYGV